MSENNFENTVQQNAQPPVPPMPGMPVAPQYPPQPPQNIQPPKKQKNGRVIALVLCCSLLGGIVGAGGALLGTHIFDSNKKQTTMLIGQRETEQINYEGIESGTPMTPAEVYASNVNSTVGITTSITTNFFGYQTTSAASGSGFIITEDGYILTNFHVIKDSSSITVTLFDGTTYEAALVGYDASNDIAVLKADAEGLTPVVLGDSDNLHVGDSVLAIGNPLGELTFSLTSGAVSALDREITMENGATMDLIQTDCAINSGNSGGALFNLYGEVVGITNAKYSGNGTGASIDNIGFAIPINAVQNIVKSIIENGYIAKPYIGVSVTDVSEETQSYGLPKGASVREITKDGPAAKAGLQVNDIVTKVNDKEITGSRDLVEIVGNAVAGDVLKCTVYRQGETLELSIEVDEKVQSAREEEQAKVQAQSEQGNVLPWGFDGF